MKFHKQRFMHNPPEEIGDCHRTAIACMLDLEPEQVPHFGKIHWENGDAWYAAEAAFLREHGFAHANIWFEARDDLKAEHVMATMKHTCPDVYYLLGGKSRTGNDHTVIGLNDQIAHDPSPLESGIIGPMTSGYYIITLFIPLRFTKQP